MNLISSKKKSFLIVLVSIILAVVCIFGIYHIQSQAASGFVVYLYPGHSPSNSSKLEATLNEKVTIKLYNELTRRGYIVYITNSMTLAPDLPHILTEGPVGDDGKPASQYHFGTQLLPAINTPEKYNANIPAADLCIGIHHNAEPGYSIDDPVGSANGYEIYYSSTLTEDYGKNTETVTRSRDMANYLDQQLDSDFYINRRSGAVKDADVNSVTTRSKVPSILLEAGFMTNAYDRSQITKESNMEILAQRIADAVDLYSQKYPSDKNPPVLNSVTKNPAVDSYWPGFEIAANVTDQKSGVDKVEFAVWTTANGQDDLKWYTATNMGNNNYQFYCDILKYHNGEGGEYNVHIYATDKAGNRALVGTTSVNVLADTTGPSVSAVTVTGAKNGIVYTPQFTASSTITDKQSGVKSVKAAVWSADGGQDDLKWYTAANTGNNQWSVDLDIEDHGNGEGLYYIHFYAYDQWDNSTLYASSITYECDETPPVRGDSLKYVNNPYAFTATLPVVDAESGVSKVEFAVWSDKDGQDDLLWHAGTEISPGTWQTYVNYTSHKKDTGTYNVHVYATDNCGNRALISATQTTVTGDVNGPTATSITPAQSFSGRTCTVSVEGVTDAEAGTEGYESGVKTVKFAVWTAENGQDDIQWLTGKNLGNGKWQITFDVADHNYDSGLYYIHVNGYDNAGNYRLMKTTTATATGDFKAPTRGGNLKYVNNPYAFTATIPVVDNYSGVAKVEFAVWSEENGQDDLVWHEGTEISSGTWQTYVNYASHKKDTGTYNVHVYATDNAGNRALISATQTTVTGDVNGPTATSITPAQSFSGRTCTVSVEGVTDAEAGTEGYESGVKTVKFAVWTAENGQDDIQWLTGKNLGNGKWQITFDVADHNYDSGLYYIHVNGYDNAGNYRLMKTTTATATGDFKAPVFVGMDVSSAAPEYTFKAFADVLDDNSGVSKVEFAVWSAKGGQDDLTWYVGEKSGTMRYTANVDYRDHNEDTGLYYIHLYATDNAGNRALLYTTQINMTGDKTPPYASSVEPDESIVLGDTFNILVHGLSDIQAGYEGCESGVDPKTVQVGIWSAKDGQDDLKWYTMSTSDNVNYWKTVDIGNHDYDSGIYYAHVYASDHAGNRALVGTAQLTVGGDKIMGGSLTNSAQLMRYYTSNAGANNYETYRQDYIADGVTLERICELYIECAQAEGVRAEVAFAQAMKETGWLRFGGQVQPMQYNFAGLGALDGGAQGFDFRSTYGAGEAGVRAGILAQIQHLKCYASTESLNILNSSGQPYDPRWDAAVNKYGRGSSPFIQTLGGKWASDSNYGYDLANMVTKLLNS